MANRCTCEPRPICALDGCTNQVKRRSLRFCCKAHGHAGQSRWVRDQYPPKVCVACGKTFAKPSKLDRKRWEARLVCGWECELRRRTGGQKPRQAPKPVARTPRPPKPPQTASEPVVVREPWRPTNIGRDVRPRFGV